MPTPLPTPDQTRAELPVLIVGAGPTGLTLACDLARRGVNLRIIDKSPTWFAGSRGKGLQPRSLELLDDLGIVDQILANGRFHLPFRGYDGPTVLGDLDIHEGRHPTPDVPYASVLIIPQFRVALNYRGGPLAQGEASLSTTLQPGDRAPDSPLRDHQGREVRLFDLFRGPHFTLLEFAAGVDKNPPEYEPATHRYKILRATDAPARENEMSGQNEHIWKSYGVESDALFLIRPDGYIGFIGHRGTAPQVKDYLRNMQPQMI